MSSQHSYASEYPAGIDFDPAYKKFFEDFYAVSDTPDVHENYADNFTDDATLIMASKTVKGRAGTFLNIFHQFLTGCLRKPNLFRFCSIVQPAYSWKEIGKVIIHDEIDKQPRSTSFLPLFFF